MKNGVRKILSMPFGIMLCLGIFFCAFQPVTVVAADEKALIKAEEDLSLLDLAKKSENPISDIKFIRLQYNAFTGGKLGNSTMSLVNLQSASATHLNKDWSLINRTTVPLISAPSSEGRINGLGDSQVTFFFSPRNTGATTWGIGPMLQLPTATNASLGAKTFAIGPAAVIVKEDKQWLYGAQISYFHRVGDTPNGIDTNMLTIQPIVKYNVPNIKGMSICYIPVISCDFSRESGDRWLVPLGFQVSKVTKIGKKPVSIDLGAYKNVTRTSSAPKWNYRLQLTFFITK